MSGVSKMMGQMTEKRGPAVAGETVALGKLDHAKTGDTLSSGKQAHAAVATVTPYPGVLAIAISAKERKDDVKLGLALNKLVEEDPSLTVIHNPETHEVVVWGQGEMHLRVATERLADRFGVAIERQPADRRLSRDHQEADRAARSPQEAVGRPRPVRRRRARHQAAAAQLRLRVRGEDHRRRGAAQLHPVGRGGRDRRAQARPAGIPRGRRCGGADRRLLSHASIPPTWRSASPAASASPRRCRNASRCCWSRSTRSRSSARPTPPPRSTPSCRDAAARSSASTPARAGTAGTWCARMMPESEIGDLIIEVRSATAGRRQLHLQVRPHGGIHRKAGRPDRGRKARRRLMRRRLGARRVPRAVHFRSALAEARSCGRRARVSMRHG